MTIAGVNLGQVALGALGRGARNLVLTRRTPGDRGADISAGTNPETQDYAVLGRRTDHGKALCFTLYSAQLPIRPMKDDTITDGDEVFFIESVEGTEGLHYCYTTDLED